MPRRHQTENPTRIDPLTGLDAEDLFGQVEWHQARGLVHKNDDVPNRLNNYQEQKKGDQ